MFAFSLTAERPNIVVILVDDLGYGDVNFDLPDRVEFNNPHIKTPRLAQLAREGLLFTHHYSPSPVCSPTRAGLLTGRVPTRAAIDLFIRDLKDNGLRFLRGSELTLAEVLKEAGYDTAIFGKWHLNGADWNYKENWTGWTESFPNQQGFDVGYISKENPHYTTQLLVNTQRHPGDFFDLEGNNLPAPKGYTSDLITEWASDWLDSRGDTDKPFFLYLPYDAPHVRVQAAERFEAMYDTGDTRRDAYYANITHLDDAIGNFLDHLEVLGLAENTIVHFSSDNGPDVMRSYEPTAFCYGTSYPLKGMKFQLWEGGIRSPGIVRWPAKIKPGISGEPNSLIDFMPTIIDLLDLESDDHPHFDGSSLASLWLDHESVERHQPLYWEFTMARLFPDFTGEGYTRREYNNHIHAENGAPTSAVRDGDWMLLGFSMWDTIEPDYFELYNVAEDVAQEHEVSEKYPEIRDRLIEWAHRLRKSARADHAATLAWIDANRPATASTE